MAKRGRKPIWPKVAEFLATEEAKGMSYREIAEKFGVSGNTVQRAAAYTGEFRGSPNEPGDRTHMLRRFIEKAPTHDLTHDDIAYIFGLNPATVRIEFNKAQKVKGRTRRVIVSRDAIETAGLWLQGLTLEEIAVKRDRTKQSVSMLLDSFCRQMGLKKRYTRSFSGIPE